MKTPIIDQVKAMIIEGKSYEEISAEVKVSHDLIESIALYLTKTSQI